MENLSLDRHGVIGDRRYALRRRGDASGFPWLTASKLPALISYRVGKLDDRLVPATVCAPSGEMLECEGTSMSRHFAVTHNVDVELAHLRQGMFDAAGVSIITQQTLSSLGQLVDARLDPRRFRPNVLIDVDSSANPYPENDWVGHSIAFGNPGDGVRVAVTELDERCVMISIDPDTGQSSPELLRAVVQHRDNFAGVYAVPTRIGSIAIGDSAYVHED
jgi:uncharacterized protein YcbX